MKVKSSIDGIIQRTKHSNDVCRSMGALNAQLKHMLVDEHKAKIYVEL